MRRRIYLMRHADVRYADGAGRPLHPDRVPLTEEGRRQARAVAEALSAVPLDRAISSGLPRTDETAELVLSGRGLRVEVREALREIRPGRVGDIPAERFAEAFLGALSRPVMADDRFLGGESWGSLAQRVRSCFEQLRQDQGWRHLLVVAHGGVNRLLLLAALGADLEGVRRIEQDPACLNILDLEDDGHVLVRLLNHTVYDPAKTGLVETTMERLYRAFREA